MKDENCGCSGKGAMAVTAEALYSSGGLSMQAAIMRRLLAGQHTEALRIVIETPVPRLGSPAEISVAPPMERS